MHGVDHRPGGPDPIPGGGGAGGGIDFNKGNNSDADGDPADYLLITVNGTGAGPDAAVRIVNAATAGEFELVNDTDAAMRIEQTGAADLDLLSVGTGGVNVTGHAAVTLHSTTGDVVVSQNGHVKMPNLPTTDPGVAGRIWNDHGTVVLSGSTSGGSPGVSGKVDRDAVEIATARLVQVKLAAGDTQPAFKITGDGKLQWGPGGAAALDMNLYRAAAGQLRTDGTLWAFGTLVANLGSTAGQVYVGAGGAGKISFGSAEDTNLYRSAAAVLRSDGELTVSRLAGRGGADLTISSSAITVTGGFHRITGGGPTIQTINGGVDGAILTLNNRVGTVNFATGGNILMSGPGGIPVNGARILVYSGYDSAWVVTD
jgi:hypothetical protein